VRSFASWWGRVLTEGKAMKNTILSTLPAVIFVTLIALAKPLTAMSTQAPEGAGPTRSSLLPAVVERSCRQ
jgi:hypothetical protein